MRAALLAILCATSGFAQVQHVQWTLTADPAAPGGKTLLHAAGKVDPGWHLYSASSPAGIPTSFQVGPDSLVESIRTYQPPPKRAFDKNFDSDTETYQSDVTFLVELQLKKDAPVGPADLAVKIRYQTCNDTQCVPSRYSGTVPVNITPGATAPTIPAGYVEAKPPASDSTAAPASAGQEQGVAAFLLVAFGFGLA